MDFLDQLAILFGFLFFASFLYGFLKKMWDWAGSALPPASMIDKRWLDSRDQRTEPPSESMDKDSPVDDEKGETHQIASDQYLNGTPFLVTVTVRSLIIEFFVGTMTVLLLVGLGAERLQAMSEAVLAQPVVSILVALILIVLAVLVGLRRQFNGYLISNAAAIPAVDNAGHIRFSYIGDVPEPQWQHSPWYRAITWVLVSGGSLSGAWIGALFVNRSFDIGILYVFFSILSLRWVISAILVLININIYDKKKFIEGYVYVGVLLLFLLVLVIFIALHTALIYWASSIIVNKLFFIENQFSKGDINIGWAIGSLMYTLAMTIIYCKLWFDGTYYSCYSCNIQLDPLILFYIKTKWDLGNDELKFGNKKMVIGVCSYIEYILFLLLFGTIYIMKNKILKPPSCPKCERKDMTRWLRWQGSD